jgi:hypothetical protein
MIIYLGRYLQSLRASYTRQWHEGVLATGPYRRILWGLDLAVDYAANIVVEYDGYIYIYIYIHICMPIIHMDLAVDHAANIVVEYDALVDRLHICMYPIKYVYIYI